MFKILDLYIARTLLGTITVTLSVLIVRDRKTGTELRAWILGKK